VYGAETVYTSDNYFDLKVLLLQPVYSFCEFRRAALVCEVACVDENVALREGRLLVVGI